ncbi:glycoside hydrolase family 3 N-terminal domain-containing protein [Bacillus sp. CECT 9360]|uniref:glycoside hydrolase family 3 protein n=1 Tax=Bacillus sp. CECT 9360 TaxID=2845821 RepID=UPI001E304C3C|nr:glycoside hydrolase family 3 N-terminal domain-containing protein [Bacillus sp. CECT 9360]CAH0346739.1 Beta-glucosidase BoGH3B [Bacillus sp. CECT 9360]
MAKKRLKHSILTGLTLLALVGSTIGGQSNHVNAQDKGKVLPYKNHRLSVEKRVDDLLSRMTLEEKIGQMVQPERNAVTAADMKQYGIGSVLSGGGSLPTTGNSPADWANMVDDFQRGAMSTRLGIPIIYGVDAVHGHNNVYGATVFPHNIGLGAANDTRLMKRIGQATAKEVRATGISYVFAPVLAAPQNIRWGRTYEGYSEDPRDTGKLGSALVEGLQGNVKDRDFLKGEHVASSIKHFVGDGLTEGGDDQGNVTEYTDEEIRKHIKPYKEAIKAGARTVMVTYSSINGVKTHGDHHMITEVLKGELGFTGFVISDYNGPQQIAPNDFRQSIKRSVNAGIDLFMIPHDWKNFISTTKELVASGEVSQSRIDDAVTRILRVKFENGLFETPYADRDLVAEGIGQAEHRAIAREAVRKSQVLLKNEHNILPLKKNNSKIFVAGKKADNMGYQAGGWTISWQGGSSQWMGQPEKNLIPGTSILEGIQQAAGKNTKVDFSEDGSGAQGHDVAIVVIGEPPYAEMFGDRDDLGLLQEDIDLMNKVKATGVPMVVLLQSGRPMILTEQLKDMDALVASWLPGSEGAGIADVLFGDYPFTGKLSFTWPRNIEQVNSHDKTHPLFKKGFGLKTKQTSNKKHATVK